MENNISVRPRMSEKTFLLGTTKGVYVFDVPTGANKHVIASAVASQFGVTVVEVNTVNSKGKVTRTVRKGGRAIAGRRSDTKKAYVTLKAGEKLPFFDEPEDKKSAKKKETK